MSTESKLRTLPIGAYLKELQERNGWVYKYRFYPGEILSIVRSVEGDDKMTKEVYRGEVAILESKRSKRYVDFPQRGVRIIMDAPSPARYLGPISSGEMVSYTKGAFKGKAVNIDTYLAAKSTDEMIYDYGIRPSKSSICDYVLVIYAVENYMDDEEKEIKKEAAKYPLHRHEGDVYYADVTNRSGSIIRLLVHFFM